MARTLTPKDAYTLMNALVRQATGQTSLAATDVSSFVSAGETVLATGTENVMNALSLVLGRTFAAVRPYNAKLALINAIDTGAYTSRFRKISYYAEDALPSGWFNTDAYTNFGDGMTAGDNGGTSTKSQWEQHPAMPLEMNFGGSSTWQDCITMYEDKLEAAFRSPEDFNIFISGILTEHGNAIESQKEAFNRMTLLSAMATRYYLESNSITSGCAINMTTAFNTEMNTTYTTLQLQTVYLKEFLEFMVAKVKEISDRMTERGTHFHDPLTKTVGGINYSILRHTPYEKQRIILYGPLLRKAESMVLPEIFRPEYLDINKQFEKVEFWQSNDSDANRPKININSAYYDSVSGEQKATGAVSLDFVIGFIYDEDALLVDYKLERSLTSSLESRKGYRNSWLTYSKNAISDQTENACLLYMAD